MMYVRPKPIMYVLKLASHDLNTVYISGCQGPVLCWSTRTLPYCGQYSTGIYRYIAGLRNRSPPGLGIFNVEGAKTSHVARVPSRDVAYIVNYEFYPR